MQTFIAGRRDAQVLVMQVTCGMALWRSVLSRDPAARPSNYPRGGRRSAVVACSEIRSVVVCTTSTKASKTARLVNDLASLAQSKGGTRTRDPRIMNAISLPESNGP
jgi:hypothetical protein